MKQAEVNIGDLVQGQEAKLNIGYGRQKSIVISCEEITLIQKQIGIVFNLQKSLNNIDKIIINGVEFIRKGTTDERAD